MKILIEGYRYCPEDVQGVLPEEQILLTDEKVKIDYVGYFRNPKCDDFVFFLPKVLLNEKDRVFGSAAGEDGFRPEEILRPDVARKADGTELEEGKKRFLSEFAVWIYRAIARYQATHAGNEIVWSKREKGVKTLRRKMETTTLLDVILALRRFARENEDYFLFKVQEKRGGMNKISWTRTIAKSAAVVVKAQPIYFDMRTKKRVINFDEELLVIFYSILEHIRVKYGFEAEGVRALGYELIGEREFARYLAGYGERRLRAIRYKYFSDRDVMLWELCLAFFEKAHRANVASVSEEYLLAKDFNVIFEAMIDELIGDKDAAGMKGLENGQEMDHLYFDESLTRRDGAKTFYIADSKYYKRGNALEAHSIRKQFTYAKEMLQLNLDVFLGGKECAARKVFEKNGVTKEMRDKVTEGYDVIPNFFISATMDEGLDYAADGLQEHVRGGGDEVLENVHFTNRLFDRDTLILSHYDVNFLYVLKLYAQANEAAASAWKEKVRGRFRRHIQGILEKKFNFYAMTPLENVQEEDVKHFLRDKFDVALGKVYRPYPNNAGRPVYSLAVEKDEKFAAENEAVKKELEKAFYIVEATLGESPNAALDEEERTHARVARGVTREELVQNVLYGTYHGKKQLEFMRKSKLYHMAVETAAELGIATKADAAKKKILFALPPQRGDTEPQIFEITSSRGIVDAANIRENGWSETSHEKYYLWIIKA